MEWHNEYKVPGMWMTLHKYFLFPSFRQFMLIVRFWYCFFFSICSGGLRRRKKGNFLSARLKNLHVLYHLQSDENRSDNISSILRFILNLKSIYNQVVFQKCGTGKSGTVKSGKGTLCLNEWFLPLSVTGPCSRKSRRGSQLQ